MAWNTSGLVNNPSTDDILADTGQLGLGIFGFTIVVYSTVGCLIDIEHRNTTNTTTLHSQRVYIPAYTPMPILSVGISLSLNERLRVRLLEGVTGDVQVSVLN